MRLQGKCALITGAARGIGLAFALATDEAKYIVAQCFGVDGGNWLA